VEEVSTDFKDLTAEQEKLLGEILDGCRYFDFACRTNVEASVIRDQASNLGFAAKKFDALAAREIALLDVPKRF
jgi:hypothetical protein